jgi:membrane protease YdiL (CAAX protease family)
VVGQAVAGVTLVAAGSEPSWIDGAGLVAADVATLLVILLAARRGADRLGPSTFGLRRTDATAALGWGVLAYVGYVAFAGLWATVVGLSEESGGATSPSGELSVTVVALLFLGVVVAAPIVEEVVFRGYLFAALTRWKGPWPAALVSGALFGAAHLLVYPPLAIVPLAVMGFFLALVFWTSGSLLPCIALHAANNALVLSIAVGWSWQVPLAVVGIPAVIVLALLPISRQRAPQATG